MCCCRKDYELYGLSDYHRVIDDLLALCHCESDHFAMAVITTEALTNAFVHGNSRDEAKPIRLTACVAASQLWIKVEDSGGRGMSESGTADTMMLNPWQEGGRGLFLMGHYADQVTFDRNTVIIRKQLCAAMDE